MSGSDFHSLVAGPLERPGNEIGDVMINFSWLYRIWRFVNQISRWQVAQKRAKVKGEVQVETTQTRLQTKIFKRDRTDTSWG